jgi:predicted acyl esterase
LAVSTLFAAEIQKTTVLVPMRDGTRLATDVYLPPAWQEPMPVLLKRTPYNKNTDGRLTTEEPADADAQLTYRYDPSDPVPTIGGRNMTIAKGPMDQRRVESRPDVLVFTGDVLDAPLEVTGRIRAKLYISSDCRQTVNRQSLAIASSRSEAESLPATQSKGGQNRTGSIRHV